MTITENDISINVINLERCKKKLKRFDEQMKKYNLKYNRFNAIDKSTFTYDKVKESNYLTDDFKNYLLEPNTNRIGHLACTLSHIEIYKDFLYNSNENYLLIFEDDVILADNFKNILLDSLNNIVNKNIHFDILLLGFFCNSIEEHNKIVCDLNKDYYDIDNIRSVNYFMGTHGYIIPRTSIEYIINECKILEAPIDRKLSNLIQKNYKIFSIFEPIAFQEADNTISAWDFTYEHEMVFGSQTNGGTECFGNTINNNDNKKSLFFWTILILGILIIIVFLFFLLKKK